MYQWSRAPSSKTTYHLQTLKRAMDDYLKFYNQAELPRLIACLCGFDAMLGSGAQDQNEPCLEALRSIKQSYQHIVELKVRLEQPEYAEEIKANKSITFPVPPDEFIKNFDLRSLATHGREFRAYLMHFQRELIEAYEKNEGVLFGSYPYRHSMSWGVISAFIIMTFLLSLGMSFFYKQDKPLLNQALFFSVMALNLVLGLRLNSQMERRKAGENINKLHGIIHSVNSVLDHTPFYQPKSKANQVAYPCDNLRAKRIGAGLVLFSMAERCWRRDIEKTKPPRLSPRSVSLNNC